jgi:hypothetical protein
MQLDVFDVLIGLPLAIVRRAADMLVLHFGKIRPHPSGEGTIGDYALHVQCAWRFDGPKAVVTGRDDLWDYAGPGVRPANWSYDDRYSLQDERFSRHFGRDEATRSWVNEGHRYVVTAAQQTFRGDIRLELTEGYAIAVFPAGSRGEAWRFFAPGSDDDHLIFPELTGDFALSRRKAVPAADWEAWLRAQGRSRARGAAHGDHEPARHPLPLRALRHRAGDRGVRGLEGLCRPLPPLRPSQRSDGVVRAGNRARKFINVSVEYQLIG